MKAMILAAGRGKRMRPLTDSIAKPLLEAGGKPLIEWHLEKLAACGVKEVVINTAWQATQLHQALGDGTRWGVRIIWSDEPEQGLETAGGIINALPLLGDDPFWVINGDIWTDFDVNNLPELSENELGHLVLVDNPEHNPEGDFSLHDQLGDPGSRVIRPADKSSGSGLTFAGISVLRPELFAGGEVDFVPLRPFLERAIAKQQLTGQHHQGQWTDVGTPERLQQLNDQLRNQN